MNRYMELLDMPYLKGVEAAELLRIHPSTFSIEAKKRGIERKPYGYNTDDIIREFKLQDYIKRQTKKAPSPTKVESAK